MVNHLIKSSSSLNLPRLRFKIREGLAILHISLFFVLFYFHEAIIEHITDADSDFLQVALGC